MAIHDLTETATAAHAAPIAPSPSTAPGRAIVVGASSGIGAAIARQLACEGWQVAALARRAGDLDRLAAECRDACGTSGGRILPARHDVRDADEIPELFERLVRDLGGLDLLVFAAAVMPDVAPAEYDTAKDLEMLSVNLGGCIAWCNAAAVLFRTQRSGTLLGISSIAGARGRKGNPVYGASKAAMDHYLEALRNRLAEAGVHVCTIRPGFVDTAMTRGKKVFWLISAEEAARRSLDAARRRVNVRYVPRRWRLVALVLVLIPSFLFRKLSF
jgi:NAD(P)-dependent dehydrogenase (short-subunit alcohol dehydrogenase family)